MTQNQMGTYSRDGPEATVIILLVSKLIVRYPLLVVLSGFFKENWAYYILPQGQ